MRVNDYLNKHQLTIFNLRIENLLEELKRVCTEKYESEYRHKSVKKHQFLRMSGF